MKKCVKLIVLALVLALAFSMTAVAAAPGDKPTVDPADGPVSFVTTGDAAYEMMNVNFTNNAVQDGKDYIIWVVAGREVTENGETKTVYIPSESTILYIGQATASGHTFKFDGVYPKDIVDGAVMISGPGMMAIDTEDGNQEGLFTLATIKVPYMLGDVDLDGSITASDAAAVLRMVAGSYGDATDIQWLAANVDGDSSVTASDAARLLRHVAGTEPL